MNAPNPDDFEVDEKARDYRATFSVQGSLTIDIEAESLEEAKRIAGKLSSDDDFGLELDEVERVEIDHVWRHPPMFLVMRDGRKMQVSHLSEGDTPRPPEHYENKG